MAQRQTRGDLVPSAVLALIGSLGPQSRADIARTLDISPATVTQVTRDLISRGLLEELATTPSQGGRPARLLGLADTSEGRPVAIGAKVSDSHVNVVTVDLTGNVLTSSEHPFASSDPDALDQLGRLLLAEIDSTSGTLLGVGVGLPGSVDTQASGHVEAPTLGWRNSRVGARLRAVLGVPVLVENDVNTLAVAESLYGIGQRHSSYVVVTIGRGVGCGIVVDGAIYRGSRGGAGEIGHIPVTTDGPLCGCGNHGCLEAHVGEDALVTRALTAGIIGPDGTHADLVSAAFAGDVRAAEVFFEAGAVLGRALAGVVHTVDPEIVLLLGEGMAAWPYWQRGFEEAFRAHLMPSRRSLLYVTESWADEKWALGAASLVLSSPFDSAGATGDQGRRVRERLGARTRA